MDPLEVTSKSGNSPDNSKGSKTFLKTVTDLGKRLSKTKDRDEPSLPIKSTISKPSEFGSLELPLPPLPGLGITEEENIEVRNSPPENIPEKLASRLQRRPSKADLKFRNILRVDSNDSIAGLPLEKSLNFEKTKTQLKSILKTRPQKSQLEELNILKGGDIDPAIISVQEKLKRSQLEDSLEEQLRERPNIEELEAAHIISFNETVEILPTFRKSEYNRKPDTNATFRKLTPQLKIQIREELNTFKKNEMSVHELSMRHTCYH